MTVLLWGLSAERPLTAVREALARQGTPAIVIDQRDVLATAVELDVDAGASEIRGTVCVRGRRFDLRAIAAVYVRPYDSCTLAPVARTSPDSPDRQHARAVDEALYVWADLTPALVLNRPAASATNGSKPYQAALIRHHGFAVPETLITTDPAAARAFWERQGAVVYKSVSSVRSVVARLRPEDAARLTDVANCPTQFQQYVPGRDHRVHVVGEELFACEIITEADDYRYPGQHGVALRPCSLPVEVATRCLRLAAALELPLAGIDLRRDPDGVWYCFEVNSSPAFTYYEQATGQSIGRAVARLLAGAGHRPASGG